METLRKRGSDSTKAIKGQNKGGRRFSSSVHVVPSIDRIIAKAVGQAWREFRYFSQRTFADPCVSDSVKLTIGDSKLYSFGV